MWTGVCWDWTTAGDWWKHQCRYWADRPLPRSTWNSRDGLAVWWVARPLTKARTNFGRFSSVVRTYFDLRRTRLSSSVISFEESAKHQTKNISTIIYQPIRCMQSMSNSINQSINQSLNEWMNRSINQSIEDSIDQPTKFSPCKEVHFQSNCFIWWYRNDATAIWNTIINQKSISRSTRSAWVDPIKRLAQIFPLPSQRLQQHRHAETIQFLQTFCHGS